MISYYYVLGTLMTSKTHLPAMSFLSLSQINHNNHKTTCYLSCGTSTMHRFSFECTSVFLTGEPYASSKDGKFCIVIKSASKVGVSLNSPMDLTLLSGLQIRKSTADRSFPRKKGPSPNALTRVGASKFRHLFLAIST